MREILKQTAFPLVFMLICFSSNAQNKQTKSASFYHYETECLEDKLDGNFVFMAWGTGSSKKEAIVLRSDFCINSWSLSLQDVAKTSSFLFTSS